MAQIEGAGDEGEPELEGEDDMGLEDDEQKLDLASTDLTDEEEDLDELEEDKTLEEEPEPLKTNVDKGEKGKAAVALKPSKGKATSTKNDGDKAPAGKPQKGGADTKAFGKSKDAFIK